MFCANDSAFRSGALPGLLSECPGIVFKFGVYVKFSSLLSFLRFRPGMFLTRKLLLSPETFCDGIQSNRILK